MKKKVEKKKKEVTKSKSKKDLKEILKKISVQKKEEDKKRSEVVEFSDEEIFSDFFQTRRTGAPVLERIAGEQEIGWARKEGRTESDEGKKAFRYDAVAGNDNEPKYNSEYSSLTQEVSRIDFEKTGKNVFNQKVNEVGLKKTEIGIEDPLMKEKYIEARNVDIRQAGRENPFESKFEREAKKKSNYLIK